MQLFVSQQKLSTLNDTPIGEPQVVDTVEVSDADPNEEIISITKDLAQRNATNKIIANRLNKDHYYQLILTITKNQDHGHQTITT